MTDDWLQLISSDHAPARKLTAAHERDSCQSVESLSHNWDYDGMEEDPLINLQTSVDDVESNFRCSLDSVLHLLYLVFVLMGKDDGRVIHYHESYEPDDIVLGVHEGMELQEC